MLKKYFVLFFIIIGITSFVKGQSVSSEQVRALMDERDNQIKAILGPEGTELNEQERQELRNIINDIIDYEAMARNALQSTFDSITEEQRAEFVQLFGDIIRDQSLNNLDIYRAHVIYDDIIINGNTATVKTTAVLRDIRTAVSYDIEKRGERWFITDMAIDNVSTTESYRRSFQNVIRRRGFDALLDNLRSRANA
ncbi:MAG: ABC transporter substrate-binding protein [Bacteroidetes bacterium]|nr:ABC transporter substrate-binding protein [Bacteroidota bacterium]MCH8523444.1 ABC transporter substrate-binding protein [Balneolales bacterium]